MSKILLECEELSMKMEHKKSVIVLGSDFLVNNRFSNKPIVENKYQEEEISYLTFNTIFIVEKFNVSTST